MSYAIISLGGKQYRVSEGQRLLVDRLATADGKSLTPDVLLVGGAGAPALAPEDVVVTLKVVGQQRGPKIRIGKYKKRTGYKRHTGFRAALTQVEVESIAAGKRAAAAKKNVAAGPAASTAVEPEAAVAAAPEAVVTEEAAAATTTAPAKPSAAAKPKAPAKPRAASKPDAAAKPKASAKPKTAAKPRAAKPKGDDAAQPAKEDES